MSKSFRIIICVSIVTASVMGANEALYQSFKDDDAKAYKQLDQSLATQFLTRPQNEITPEMYEGYEQWKPSSMAYEWLPGVRTQGTFAGSAYGQSWRRWTSQFFRWRNYERAHRYYRAYLRHDPSLFKTSWLERKLTEFLHPPRPVSKNETRIDLGELLRRMDRLDYAGDLQKAYEEDMLHNTGDIPYADPSLRWGR